jgi:hypothetical protein
VPLVRFCVEAAKVLKAAPDGVLPAIAAEWRSLKAQVPAAVPAAASDRRGLPGRRHRARGVRAMTKAQREAVVSSLVSEIAVPELLAFIRRRHQETGTIPDDAEVRAHLAADANGTIARGEAFLREHAMGVKPVLREARAGRQRTVKNAARQHPSMRTGSVGAAAS